MTRFFLPVLSLLLCLVTLPGAASAAINLADIDFRFELRNHPDGGAANPLYGLRLDGLQGDVTTNSSGKNHGTIYTFDFERTGALMLLDIDLDGGTGGAPAVWIHGTAFGGRDAGSAYDAANSGLWDIDFMYMDNGSTSSNSVSPDNIHFDPGSIGNQGTLKITSGAWGDGGLNTEYRITDYPNNDDAFHLEYGTHRVNSEQWVGWGWLNHDGHDGANFPTNEHVYASDWLFTAIPAPLPQITPVPEPMSLFVWSLLGTVGSTIAVRRRRDGR
jgi:hypothetical protein